MRIITSDKKKGFHKIKVESPTDLWELAHLLKKGDRVEADTWRTFRVGSKEEKKKVHLTIDVEDVAFSPYKGALRVRGKIVEGRPEEYVQKGRYHSIDVKEGDVVKLHKHFSPFEWKRLQKAVKKSREAKAYILSVEGEGVGVWRITPFAVEEEAFHPFPSKRASDKERRKALQEVVAKLPEKGFIVIGNSAFAKAFVEEMKERGRTFSYVETSEGGWEGIREALLSGKLSQQLGELKAEEEAKLSEELGKAVARGMAAFAKDVERAVEMGAVKKVLVHESVLRDEGIREILDKAEEQGAEIHVFSDTPWGEQVKLLGGIVAILRFPLS